MYPFYLGLDLHKNNTYAVLIDQSGEVVDQRQFSNQETTKLSGRSRTQGDLCRAGSNPKLAVHVRSAK